MCHVILDEADEMLNMGFADAVEKILGSIRAKDKFQFILFSATVPKWVKDVAAKWMSPKHHTVNLVGEKTSQTATLVEHLCICCSVPQRQETIGDVVKVYGRDGSCFGIFFHFVDSFDSYLSLEFSLLF